MELGSSAEFQLYGVFIARFPIAADRNDISIAPYFFFAPVRLRALDREGWATGFFGNLAVVPENIAACGLVAVQAAKQFGGDAPVGTL